MKVIRYWCWGCWRLWVWVFYLDHGIERHVVIGVGPYRIEHLRMERCAMKQPASLTYEWKLRWNSWGVLIWRGLIDYDQEVVWGLQLGPFVFTWRIRKARVYGQIRKVRF